MAKRFVQSVAGLVTLFIALLWVTNVHAQSDTVVQQALALTEKGQAKEAFDLLEPLEAQRAGEPEFDLVLGIAANQTAQYSRAVFALERVLVVQPANGRARAELARALFAVGDTKNARTLLTQTKEQGVPPEVAKTIDQFLQAIDKVEEASQSTVRVFVEGSLGYDSNANSGPGTTSFAVPILPALGNITLTAGLPTAASFATLAAGVSGRRVLDSRWSLFGSLTGNQRWNGSSGVVPNNQQIDLSAGASYREDKNEYSLSALAGTSSSNGSKDRDQSGIVGEWTYRLDGFRQFNTYAQLIRMTYPISIRDVQRNVFGTSYAQLFRDGTIIFGGIYSGYENQFDPTAPQLGHTLWGLRAGGQKPLGEGLSMFASLGFEDRTFNGQDPTFLVIRHDQQVNVNLGITWIPAKSWRVTPLLSLTRTTSNVVLNDFSKQSIGVTVRREF